MIQYFSSVQEAISFARLLKQRGLADLFRGQVHPWPPLPSLFRLDADALQQAISRLEGFVGWANEVPHMTSYRDNVGAIVAIAQHYGIHTNLLDVTTSPEVAAFFACNGNPPAGSRYSVIMCASEKTLRASDGQFVLRIDVANLWRLEAQEGLFIVFENEPRSPDHVMAIWDTLLFIDRGDCHQVMPVSKIYPERKSALEVVLDHYFERESWLETADVLRSSLETYTGSQWRTYSGAFTDRRTPPVNSSWLDQDPRWYVRDKEPFEALAPNQEVSIELDFAGPREDHLRFLTDQLHGLKDLLRTPHQSAFTPAFALQSECLSEDLRQTLSTALDIYWDSMRQFPYPPGDMLEGLALLVCLLYRIICMGEKTEDVFHELCGQPVVVQYATYAGTSQGGLVSGDSLVQAIDPAYQQYLNPYWERKCKRDPLHVFNFLVGHAAIFDFSAFTSLYCREVVPTTFADTITDKIALGSGDTDTTPIPDPVNLGYFSVFEYRSYPFALEDGLEDYIYIFSDMELSDVQYEIRAAIADFARRQQPFKLRFHGYSFDDRELWEIPEVAEYSRQILEAGGASILLPYTWFFPAADEWLTEQEQRERPIGAFEVWLLANGTLTDFIGKQLSELAEVFKTDFVPVLVAQNALVDSYIREHRLDEV